MKKGACFLFVLLSSLAYSKEPKPRTVVLLSIDGFAANYFPNEKLKNLNEIASEGVLARLTPPFPSLTFPSHTTMATGCSPGKHGIVANRFIDKEKGEFNYSDETDWVLCEPIWVAAERQGIKTAVIQWPLSYGKWKNREATYHPVKFDPNRSDEVTLQEVLEKLKLSEEQRPRLILAYLHGPDSAGHRAGPHSDLVMKSLVKMDQSIGKFRSELKTLSEVGPISLVIVSDHGMAEVKEVINVASLASKNHLPGVISAEAPIFYMYLWDPSRADAIAKTFSDQLGVTVVSRLKAPKEWGRTHPRMGDVVGVVEPPKVFITKPVDPDKPLKGMHGYDPALMEMSGILLMSGDGIRKNGDLKNANGIQISSTLAELLQIQPPKDNEAKPIVEALTKN